MGSLGIDIGCISLKIALVGEPGQREVLAAAAGDSGLFYHPESGSVPGMPRQTGQTFVLGSPPNSVEQPQNAFVAVSIWACTSSPMTGS